MRTTGLALALGAGVVAVPCGAGTSYGVETVRGVGRGIASGVAGVESPAGAQGAQREPGTPAAGSAARGLGATPEGKAAGSVPGGRDGDRTPGARGAEREPGAPAGQSTAGSQGPAATPEVKGRGATPDGHAAAPNVEATRGVRGDKSESAARGAGAAPGVRATASPSGDPSRAGSRAGEGRERPGRHEETVGPTEEEDAAAEVGSEADAEQPTVDGDADVVPEPSREAVPAASVPPQQPVRQAVSRAEDPTEPVLRILPLGSGLVLIGLGLGLAFIGLRVRRG